MAPLSNRFISIKFLVLGILVILTAIVFESLLHPLLHVELHPLDDNHLLIGSSTAFLSAFLVFVLFLRTRILSKEVNKKEFELNNLYEDNVFFRLLANKSSDMVHLNDSAGNILYVNPITYNLLSYQKDEIINKPADYFIHPEDRDKIREDMGQVAQGEDIPPREIRLLQKSGDFLDVEAKGFFLNTEGEEKYIGAILHDLSKSKQNTALLKVRDEWEKTFNSINDFVSVHDKDFKIIKANSALCELLGKSPEEIIGKQCYQLFHNLNEPVENCPHKQTIDTLCAVTEIINDPNIGVPLEITCSPLFDNEGTFQGSVHIAKVLMINQRGKYRNVFQSVLPVKILELLKRYGFQMMNIL